VSLIPALRIVLTTLPDAETAGRLAHEMVEARLAACVNVLSPCRSIYRWQDVMQEDGEIPLIIKTTADRYPALETFLRERHPYQVPEILAIDVNDGLPDYLRWAAAATQP
jgi:periplasmic divalent cation tolerance protein